MSEKIIIQNDLTPRDSYLDVSDEDSLDVQLGDSSNEFSEVLELTEYNQQQVATFNVADYQRITVPDITKLARAKANAFVSKVTSFVITMNDTELTKKHKDYIKTIGKIELDNLESLMTMVEINKLMITNITERINVSMGEDYTAIMSYTNLLNQHLKLIKETQNLYRSIPSSIKRMRAEMLTNQELKNENYVGSQEIMGENFGETQFNSQKQLLKNILAEKEKRNAMKALEDNKSNEINSDFRISDEDKLLIINREENTDLSDDLNISQTIN
jgi:hypothetical protein